MKVIDSNKVAKQTQKCGKKLKVSQVSKVFVESWNDLEKDNPTFKEIKEQLGEQQFNNLFQTTITFFALNLLARTHGKKDFDDILNSCCIETTGDA